MNTYNHIDIEKKWQEQWEEEGVYKTTDSDADKENYFTLVEFAYPSGNLHVGHWYAFSVTDMFARYQRMTGKNVLFPIGFDAFGLPAENAAIKRGKDPRAWTEQNMADMRAQLQSMGNMFDTSREIATCDPDYYRWTQWMFAQFYKNDLAYRASTTVNWCYKCQTILANEQVHDGSCERCDTTVEQRQQDQWMLRITKYADQLIDDLDTLDWPHAIKESQRNWIGRSEGAEITFKLSTREEVKVFTTRPETLFGATYLVLAPEHDLVSALLDTVGNKKDVEAYVQSTKEKTDLDRQQSKEKTGVILAGVTATNPASGEEIPVWIADYVLAGYGTGAVMAVPAHDERDFAFADKFNLPVKEVVDRNYLETGIPGGITQDQIRNALPGIESGGCRNIFVSDDNLLLYPNTEQGHGEVNELLARVGKLGALSLASTLPNLRIERLPYTGSGFLINSGPFNGLYSTSAKEKIAKYVGGKLTKTYRLRDWGISRQRYWGTPIPIVHNPTLKKEIEETAPHINFYEQETWGRLVAGQKTVETRALNPEEPGRFFGDIQEGDYIKAINKKTGEVVYFQILKSWVFTSFEDYFANKEVLKKCYAPRSVPESIEELRSDYAYTEGYVERIENNGIVAWEVEKTNPGVQVVPDEHLPWHLPDDVDYTPDGTPPLARSEELKRRTKEIFGPGWEPEVETMDTFVDSSWYFYRYLDSQNNQEFADQNKIKNWMPVDFYSGGAEHTTMHLLYSRFWNKALYDLGLVPHSEPYTRRLNRGLILGPDGEKMSKSKGNVIDPDEQVQNVGADTVRLYLAFIGPYAEGGNYPWDPNGVVGMRRFLERVWKYVDRIRRGTKDSFDAWRQGGKAETAPDLKNILHKTVMSVTTDMGRLKFNTAISSLMVFMNKVYKEIEYADNTTMESSNYINVKELETFLRLLAPFAPHLAEEIWRNILGHDTSIHTEGWSTYDPELIIDDTVVLGVQVNGKVRAEIELAIDEGESTARERVLSMPELGKWLEGKDVVKFIYIPGKVVSVVVK